MDKPRKLDQFYTKESIALDCFSLLKKMIKNTNNFFLYRAISRLRIVL